MAFGFLSIIMIHSAPFNEVAAGPPLASKTEAIVVSAIEFQETGGVCEETLQKIQRDYAGRTFTHETFLEMRQKIQEAEGAKFDVRVASISRKGVVAIEIH